MSCRDNLLKAYSGGNFLEAVYACLSADRDEREEIASELVALHNERLVDVVGAFGALDGTGTNGPDFFLTRHVFEQALPYLDAPVIPVMRRVLHLYRSAGQDLMAGTIIGKFVEFCAGQPSRSQEALAEIETNHADYSDLLAATLAAGFRVDCQTFLNHAIRLSKGVNVDLRRGAIFSLANFDPQGDAELVEQAIAGLESSVGVEADDSVLAASIRAAYALLQHDRNQEQRLIALIERALSKGSDFTLHAASEFFWHAAEIPAPLIEVLLADLRRVKPTHKRTLDNIDHGIAHLIKGDSSAIAIQWLESMLLAAPNELTMEAFDSVAGEIFGNSALRNKFVTRWFMQGERALCSAARDIVGNVHHRENVLLEIDADELKSTDMVHMIFLARKIIGYLFMQPVTAASLIVSLMHQTQDDEILAELGSLLFDPLLLNYTGKAFDYVGEQAKKESGKVKETLEKSIRAVDEYLEELRSARELPALYPSTVQRESYRRNFSRQMAESMKKAEENSVLLKLVSKNVLLYGRKSINYVHGVNGQTHRMETPLHSHGVEVEYPRMGNLDPFGMDYMLRIFRNERIGA